MKTRLIITYLLNLLDLAASTYWVNRLGLGVEANPVGRWMYETGLVYPVKIVAVAILLFVLGWCIRTNPRCNWASWLVLSMYGVLALYHVILMIRILLI